MSGNCEPIFDRRAELVQKYEEANEAINKLASGIARTMAGLAAAEAAFLACSLASPLPPVALGCAVGAGIVIARILAELHVYEVELENAERAKGEALDAIAVADGILAHCKALATWQEEAAMELLALTPDAGMIDVPDVDDSGIEELESMLAEIEQPDYDDAYA